MRNIIRASLLSLSPSSLTHAGVMPTPAPDPQPTLTTRHTTQEAAYGHIPNDLTGGGTATTVTRVMLGLLRGVPALF